MSKIDILETKTAIVVSAELPGIDEDKVDVEIMENVMTISVPKIGPKVVKKVSIKTKAQK